MGSSEDTEDLMGAIVNCEVHELVKQLKLIVVMVFKSPVNLIASPNHM